MAQWLLSLYLVAPALGWHWFVEQTALVPQAVLQVGVWGGSLGAFFARAQVRRSLGGPGSLDRGPRLPVGQR